MLSVEPETELGAAIGKRAPMAEPIYRRVIVKISGEALAGGDGCQDGELGIRQATLERIAADLAAARALGVTLGVVVGGGNFIRGAGASQRACRA